MKKIILMITLFIIGLSTLVNAQEPTSIRSQSLGNIIVDDWDLIYDPIELRFVDGKYFFTNLADFNNYDWDDDKEIGSIYLDIDTTTYGVQKISRIRSNFYEELPIGFSTKNPIFGFLKHSFLLRIQNSKKPETAKYGKGEYEYNSTDYNYFVGESDNYNTKTLTTGKYVNYDVDRRTAFIINNNLEMGPMTFGWKLAFDNKISEEDEAKTAMGTAGFGTYLSGVTINDYGFNETTTNYLIGDGYLDHNFSEKGSFLTTDEDSYAKSHMSFMIDIGLELRADLINQKLINGRTETNDSYSGDYTTYNDAEDMQDDSFSKEYGRIAETYKNLIEDSYTLNKLGGSVKKVFDSNDERKNVGFWQVGAMLGISSGDYKSSTENQLDRNAARNDNFLDSTSTIWHSKYSEHEYQNDIGDISGSSIDMFGRLQFPIGDDINFGFGAFYNYRNTSRETEFLYESTIVTEYIDMGIFDDVQDYTLTENSKQVAERTYETEVLKYIIPIGLEFKMPKDDLTDNDPFSFRNFSFRIGTTFFSNQTIIKDKKQLSASYPHTEIKEYGDGDVDVDIDNNSYASTSEQTERIIANKRVSFGIGYNHSDNLQIDLGGYGSEYESFAGISFTIKF